LNDQRSANRVKLMETYQEYLNLVEKYLNEYKLPYKNTIDNMEVNIFCFNSRLNHYRAKLTEKEGFLTLCPNKQQVLLRENRVAQLKEQLMSLNREVDKNQRHLDSLHSLDTECIKEFQEAVKDMEEIKFVEDQLL